MICRYHDARSFRFLAIPFAEPPTGALRFREPLPYNGSASISAFKAGKACIQRPSIGTGPLNNTSEDCLTLNVFTPYIPATDKPASTLKPVMVFFYGGSYEAGYAGQKDYDGGNLAARGDVLLVTVNYRVGVLGFLTTRTSLRGNQGIQDQVLALEWVQQNM